MRKIIWIFRFLAKPQYDRGMAQYGKSTAQTAILSLRASRKTCVAKQGEAKVSLVIHKQKIIWIFRLRSI